MFIDKAPKNVWPLRGDESELSFPKIFAQKYRKIHLGGCFAFLGNDGILELFALNAKILGAELDYYDLRRVSWVNPNVATEIRTPEK